jgi:hypothetical protein
VWSGQSSLALHTMGSDLLGACPQCCRCRRRVKLTRRIQVVRATASVSRRGFADSTEEVADGGASDGRAAAVGAAAEGPRPVAAGDRVPGGLLASRGGADRAAAPAAVGPPGPLGARTGTAEAGRPGGDHPRRARWTVLHRDRRPAGEGDLHGVAGGRRGWWPGSVPSVAGAPARPAAGQAAQDPEAGPPAAGRAGQRLAGRMVVAAADLGPVADPVPRRSHDAGEPRNHLPGPVRAGPR